METTRSLALLRFNLLFFPLRPTAPRAGGEGTRLHTHSAMAATAFAPLPCAPRPGVLPPELEAALAPDEAASALLARCAATPLPSGLPLVGCLRPGEVLEFVGPSGVGKTALLVQVRRERERGPDASGGMRFSLARFSRLPSHILTQQVAAATILPEAWDGLAVGGRGGKAGG